MIKKRKFLNGKNLMLKKINKLNYLVLIKTIISGGIRTFTKVWKDSSMIAQQT